MYRRLNLFQEKVKSSERSPFPEAPTLRKVDIELETGEYWQKEAKRKEQRLQEKKERSTEVAAQRRTEKIHRKDQTAPKEAKKSKGFEAAQAAESAAQARSHEDAIATAASLKEKLGGKSTPSKPSSSSASDYVSGRKSKRD